MNPVLYFIGRVMTNYMYLTIKESDDQLLLCILPYRRSGDESCTLLHR
jgi:hypothetical protein